MDSQFSVQSVSTFAKEKPGLTLVIGAVLAVLAIVLIYEVNQALNMKEKINRELAKAETIEDYDSLLRQYKGKRAEPQILLEKLLYLVRDDRDHTPDYAAAKEILDQLNGNKKWAAQVQNVVWASGLSHQVIENYQFEKKLKEQLREQGQKKDDPDSTDEVPNEPNDAPKDD